MTKGSALFIGWSINTVGPFLQDKDGNHYLIVTMDPFYKWVETHSMPSLYSWCTFKFLYDDVVAFLDKPRYVWMDNNAKFAGSFA